jgi:hypothetical protein
MYRAEYQRIFGALRGLAVIDELADDERWAHTSAPTAR